MRTAARLALLTSGLLLPTACESGGAHPAGPKGREAFARFVAIGTGLTTGVQSGGILYAMQAGSWPALVAQQAGAPFTAPLLRAPGCPPPLIAPLQLGRFLSGTSVMARDSSCAGTIGSPAPPLNNLALPGASAWAMLTLTPKATAAAPARYDVLDRARYPLTLGSTQSQVTAMIVERPSFVAVEAGMSEVIGAVTTGMLVGATSYAQATPFTYVPADIFAPVFAAIADSVRKTGARAVLLSVPHVTKLVSLRGGAELWADRATLATFGVTVAADCNGSANRVFTPSLVPGLVARASATLAAQTLSCTDIPGAADAVLTPADVTTLDSVVDQMNAQIRKLADDNGWAFADLDAEYSSLFSAHTPYRAAEELSCVYPYGDFVSLDGVHPNSAGHHVIANVVSLAVNSTYGLEIPVSTGLPVARTVPCP